MKAWVVLFLALGLSLGLCAAGTEDEVQSADAELSTAEADDLPAEDGYSGSGEVVVPELSSGDNSQQPLNEQKAAYLTPTPTPDPFFCSKYNLYKNKLDRNTEAETAAN